MVKHTQTIRRQQPTNCLSVFDHFVGLAPKRLTTAFLQLKEIVIVRSYCAEYYLLSDTRITQYLK